MLACYHLQLILFYIWLLPSRVALSSFWQYPLIKTTPHSRSHYLSYRLVNPALILQISFTSSDLYGAFIWKLQLPPAPFSSSSFMEPPFCPHLPSPSQKWRGSGTIPDVPHSYSKSISPLPSSLSYCTIRVWHHPHILCIHSWLPCTTPGFLFRNHVKCLLQMSV